MSPRHRVLVVDDEEINARVLADLLEKDGHETKAVFSGSAAIRELQDNSYDLVLSDIRMEGEDGFKVLEAAHRLRPEMPVILMTAFADTDSVLQALRGGAADYITKPYVNEDVRLTLRRCLELSHLRAEIVDLRRTLHETYAFPNLLGKAPVMKSLFSLMEKVIPYSTQVLITGESGTGKELVAKAIHFSGPRADKPFVALNCGAMPETLLESELFGHVRGAFTDAKADKKGLVAAAEEGSLLLDEISEMSPTLQVKLLRLLQEKEYRPVGGTTTFKADVRILAATNKNLADEVQAGRFRQDLYFRLNVVELRIPPLRDRRDDILLLARSFLSRFSKEHGKPVKTISPEAARILMDYPWPGNVRELENTMERAVLFADSEEVTPRELQPLLDARSGNLVQESMEERLSMEGYAEKFYKNFNDKIPIQDIAKTLGVSRKWLWERRKIWDGVASLGKAANKE